MRSLVDGTALPGHEKVVIPVNGERGNLRTVPKIGRVQESGTVRCHFCQVEPARSSLERIFNTDCSPFIP